MTLLILFADDLDQLTTRDMAIARYKRGHELLSMIFDPQPVGEYGCNHLTLDRADRLEYLQRRCGRRHPSTPRTTPLL